MALDLTELEVQQLTLLIDLAVKAQGVRIVSIAAAIVAKLEAAASQEAANQPTKPDSNE